LGEEVYDEEAAMALGESRSSLEEIMMRELTRQGEGAVEAPIARRIATALAAAIDENNYALELRLIQKLQTSGLHV
jgi:hypothetical protein